MSGQPALEDISGRTSIVKRSKPCGKPAILLVTLGILCIAGIPARSPGQTAATASARGAAADPYMSGMAPAPPGYVYAPQGTVATQSSAALNRNTVDSLGLGYVYGPGIPMTPTQAGMSMLMMQQRMLGIGNGQLSGARPAANPDPRFSKGTRTPQARTLGPGSHPGEAHTANMNVPGGQAARFFNRGGNLATSRSQPYYQRQGRYFPQSSQ